MTGIQKLNLFGNINYLLRKRHMKKSDLETAAGVSPGYMSRFIRSEDEANLPSLAFVESAARQLDTTVDALLNTKRYSFSEPEELICDFLIRLAKDTREGTLRWKTVKADTQLAQLKQGKEPAGPFYVKDEQIRDLSAEAEDGGFVEVLGFAALDDMESGHVDGEYFTALINGQTPVYFIPLEYFEEADLKEDPLIPTSVSLVLAMGGEETEILYTYEYGKGKLDLYMEELQEAIRKTRIYESFSKSHIQAIDAYLNRKDS